MISADEIVKLIKQGKSLQEISNLLDKQYYELRTTGFSPNQVKLIRNNLICDLYKFGLDTNKICQIMNNLNRATFYSIIRTYSDKKLSSELKDEITDERIYQLREQGLSISKIEEITGISRGKIDRTLGILYAKKGKEQPKTKLPKSKRKTENDEIDESIRKGLDEGKTLTKIAEELDMSKQGVSQRKHMMIERDNKKLASMIVNLITTKNATIEQIKIMGEYYGVDIEEVLNSLDEQER